MPAPTHGDVPSPPPRPGSARWWTGDRGWWALAQWPNPALVVWLLSVVVGWSGVLDASRSSTLDGIGHGALVVWALDELARGANPARRLAGAVVLTAQVVRFFA